MYFCHQRQFPLNLELSRLVKESINPCYVLIFLRGSYWKGCRLVMFPNRFFFLRHFCEEKRSKWGNWKSKEWGKENEHGCKCSSASVKDHSIGCCHVHVTQLRWSTGSRLVAEDLSCRKMTVFLRGLRLLQLLWTGKRKEFSQSINAHRAFQPFALHQRCVS